MMISYAQNHEDVLLNRAFEGRREGYYLDVGANDPILHSVTKHFYELGWRGINIEPEGRTCAVIRADRPDDLTLNVGISDAEGMLTFYDATDSQGWSTFSREQAEYQAGRGIVYTETSVPVLTLAATCERYVDRPIDFLKIDAESHERQVILGADWSRWRPRIVLVEANGVEDWEPLLLAADYLYATDDGLNRYYVREEDRPLIARLTAPINVFDEFIPVRHHRAHEELHRLRRFAGIGDRSLELALRLNHLAERHPRCARVARRLLRPAR